MRILIALIALFGLALSLPAAAQDRQTADHDSWRPRGQGDILNFPDYREEFYRDPFDRYYRDPFSEQYYRDPFCWQPGYNRDGFEYRYHNGDFDGRIRYRNHDWGRQDYRHGYPNCSRPYGYDRVYYSPDGVSVRYFGQPDYADYYYSGIRPVEQYYDERYYEPYVEEPQEPTVNIYNYYETEGAAAAAAPAPAPMAQTAPAAEAEQEVQVEAGDRPWGRVFYGSAVIETEGSVYDFSIKDRQLIIAPQVGPGVVVAENIEESLGVLASYQPAAGLMLVFVSDSKLTAAVEGTKGWVSEPLPIKVDLQSEVSLAQMGGYPWVVFNGVDGTRYVYTFGAAGWQLVGSATPPPAG